REYLLLLFHVLDDGFDDDVAIGECLRLGHALEPRADLLRRLFQRALLGKLGQRFLDPGKALIEKRLLLLQHGHVITGGRADLGDARSHQPAAKHAYFFNNHFVLLEYSSEHSAVSTVIQHSAFSRQHSALTPLSSISFPAKTFETQRNRGNGGFDNF